MQEVRKTRFLPFVLAFKLGIIHSPFLADDARRNAATFVKSKRVKENNSHDVMTQSEPDVSDLVSQLEQDH